MIGRGFFMLEIEGNALAYNKIVGRPTTDAQTVVPDQVVKEVIQTATQSSALLSKARPVPMSSKTYHQPVLASLPEADFVGGTELEDTAGSGAAEPGFDGRDANPADGLKSTSNMGWKPLSMTAEEIAVIVPIPDALVDDSAIPLWESAQPLMAEAVAKRLDEAGIFGVRVPKSWDLKGGLIGAANAYQVDASKFSDYGAAIADAGEQLGAHGVPVTGFISRPGLGWAMAKERDAVGNPIYAPATATTPATIYGLPTGETLTGSWNPARSQILAGDWSKVFVGIRQDVTFQLFREGVITDETGKVVLNLMTQDAKALRCVFRVGVTVAKPIDRAGRETLPLANIFGKPTPITLPEPSPAPTTKKAA
ncbi:hypothetical protein AWN90_11415 [Nocardia terpenica]|uniref:Phage capsid-like C-terminal domain-containing protein n=1 Tax=Nocardia terpenica TaxID=455432 RepID=A0A164HFM7_9NOCA|nr:hypothetical protein AWN90_11415 [Nocardia terpenica]